MGDPAGLPLPERIETKDEAIARSAERSSPARRFLVVGFEPNPEREGRVFFVARPVQLANALSRLPPLRRRFHEHIPANRAMRLFFDLDDKSGAADLDGAVVALRSAVRAKLASAPLRCVVLDGSRPGKLSRHVVFSDVVCSNLSSIRNLVDNLWQVLPPAVQALIDRSVYRADGSLRTAFSTAYDKNSWFVPLGRNPAEASDFFRHADFLDSLVTNVLDGTGRAFELDEGAGPGRSPRAVRGGAAAAGWEPGEVFEAELALADFVQRVYPGARDVVAEAPRPGFDACVAARGVPCARKGAPHAHNRIFLNVRLPPRAWAADFGFLDPEWRCLKPECCGARWWDRGTSWEDEPALLRRAFREFLVALTMGSAPPPPDAALLPPPELSAAAAAPAPASEPTGT
jgi:hypothetical protein